MTSFDQIRVTPATADDIDAVTDLWVDLASGQRAYGSTLLADGNRNAVRDSVARGVVTGELLVARRIPDDVDRSGALDGATDPIGFVGFSLDHGGLERDETRGVVDNLFVAPTCRGEGVGSALLSAAERALRESGATEITLEAMAANDRARSFYRGFGYESHRVVLRKRLDETD
ncbi:N-acetyltransferase [Halorubrum luteum]